MTDISRFSIELYNYMQEHLGETPLYLRRAPIGQSYPYVTMIMVSAAPHQDDLCDQGGLSVVMQFDCYALDDASADGAAGKVLTALYKTAGNFALGDTIECLSSSFDSLSDAGEFIDPDMAGENLIIRKQLNFTLHIEEK